MNIQNRTPSKGRGRTMKKTDRLSPEEALKKVLEDHKNSLGEVVQVKVDNRTYIELPANMSKEERDIRIKNYLKNTNFKPSN